MPNLLANSAEDFYRENGVAMNTITITLPIPKKELSPNGRTHHMVKARHTKTARTLAQVEMHNAMIVAGWSKQPKWLTARVEAVVIRKDRRGKMDDDNFKASCKAYQDGIADAGLVVNDRGIKWGDVEWTVDKSKEPCVVLTFTELT